MLDDYLARWETIEKEEMFWDSEAREAVEKALEGADWDEASGTITLFDPDEDRIWHTVSSREELERYLGEAAEAAFYSYAPRDSSEFVYECDEDGIVQAALKPYEERLATFFENEDK